VRVSFYATLRPLVGGKAVEVPLPQGATVRDLVRELVRRWPALADYMLRDDGTLSRRVNVFVDGRNVRWLPEREETPLTPEASVHVFPPVAGG
jgi:molybdopterin synthase sulfur carrier subunit